MLNQTVDLIALILANLSFSPKRLQVLKLDGKQAFAQKTIELLNTTIAPRFASWIEKRFNTQIGSDANNPAERAREAVRASKF